MVLQFVVAPETHRPQGLSHAVNVDGRLYIGGTVARDKDGFLVGKGDFAAQVGQVFSNLGEVLKAAGLSLDDVAFVNTYLTTWKNWWRLRDVRPKYLPEAQWAGTTVVAQMEDPDMLVGIELVAAASREAVAVPDLYQVRSATSAAAHAVKVGNLTYVRGQIAWDRNDRLVGEGDIRAQAEQVYQNLEAALRASGAAWSDVVKANTFLTNRGGLAGASEVQGKYLGEDRCTGTTIIASQVDPYHPEVEPRSLLEVELVAQSGTKHPVVASGVHTIPGFAHAVRAGKTVYLGAQAPLNESGRMVGRADCTEQAEQVYANIGAVLQAAGASFADVVKVSSYLPRREDISPAKQVRERYLPGPQLTSTTVLAPLIDPDWLITTECIAVVE